MTATQMIKIDVTPQQILDKLPSSFLTNVPDPQNGFSDRSLTLTGKDNTEVTYSLSFDGESELLASVVAGNASAEAESVLIRSLFIEDETDSPEDEDEDEDENESAD